MEQSQAPEAEARRSPGVSTGLALGALLLGLGTWYWSGADDAPAPAAERAAGRPVRPRPAVIPAPSSTSTTTTTTPPFRPVPPSESRFVRRGPVEPTPDPNEATTRAEDEGSYVDELREQGRRRLDAALGEAATELRRAEHFLDAFERQCRTSKSAVAPSGCGDVLGEIREASDRAVSLLDAAEADARRSWLEAGAVRQARSAHGVDRARVEALMRRVRRAQGEDGA